MRKRVQVALAVSLVSLAGVLGWQVLALREPRYGGKPLSAWLADLDLGRSNSPDQAVRAVRTIGTNSFPWLTRSLCTGDPSWKRAALAFNAKQSLIRLPVNSSGVVRYRAVQGYIALGSGARDNVPALIQILESKTSPEVRSCVAAALGGIGPEANAALPALWKAAQDKDPELHKCAVRAISNIQVYNNDPAYHLF